MLLTLCPAYVAIHVDWTFIPERNRTLLGLVVSDDRDEVESITVALNVAMQLLFFCAIVGSNTILVYELQKKTKWRQGATLVHREPSRSNVAIAERSGEDGNIIPLSPTAFKASTSRFLSVPNGGGEAMARVKPDVERAQKLPSAAEQAAIRDRKLARMIVFLSTILFVCYLPSTICLVTQLLEPEFSIKGDYENIFFVGWSFAWIADAINSSVNIFVYYNMSTKYRETFQNLFVRWHKKWRRIAPHTSTVGSNKAFVSHDGRAFPEDARSSESQHVQIQRKSSETRLSSDNATCILNISPALNVKNKKSC